MDILTLLGVLTGLAALVFGHHLEGGQLSSLLNYPALLIVLGGTLGAVLVQSSFKNFCKALHILWWVFFPPKISFGVGIEKLENYSNIARKKGLLALENELVDENDPFLKRQSNYC